MQRLYNEFTDELGNIIFQDNDDRMIEIEEENVNILLEIIILKANIGNLY